MKFKCVIEYEYPVEHKPPVKAEIVLHGDRVTTDKIVPYKVRPHGEWIPCSERLPEEYKTVIASTEYGVFPEAQYTKEYGWEWAYESGADYWEELEGVTAWMPLPEPYKKEGDSDA